MMKRIILAVFLLFNFQFALADIASDIEAGLGVDQAVQNAIDAGESPAAIASALQSAGISAFDAVIAMTGAGIENAISITAAAFGMEPAALVALLADVPIGGLDTGTVFGGAPGLGGGGGGGGGTGYDTI